MAYVGGYQGAPVSHLLDVLVDAEDYLAELGVHVETCTNEASAAAMLGASINYPLRGAVTWKSIVGTNVAADALSNLASPGVIGGALIILGEDYGEGASVIQERSYAYALKSSIWLLDPRPDLPTIVRMVEKGFELSEASHAPVMLELRIRACHVTGEFAAKDNRSRRISGLNRIDGPPRFDYARLAHPPVTFAQEKLKIDERMPAARDFIRRAQAERDSSPATSRTSASSSQGGLYNGTLRALERLGLADMFGECRIPICASTSPIRWCRKRFAPSAPARGGADRRGRPPGLHRAGGQRPICAAPISRPACYGKDVLPKAGEYTVEVLLAALRSSSSEARPAGSIVARGRREASPKLVAHLPAVQRRSRDLPPRPPTFCTGCPERPVFSALKLTQREIGPAHLGRHRLPSFATVRAVLHGQFDPRLRHVACERGRGRPEPAEAADRRSWATAASGTTA